MLLAALHTTHTIESETEGRPSPRPRWKTATTTGQGEGDIYSHQKDFKPSSQGCCRDSAVALRRLQAGLRPRGTITRVLSAAQLLSRGLPCCYYSEPGPHSEDSPAVKPSVCHSILLSPGWAQGPVGAIYRWGQLSGWLLSEPTATWLKWLTPFSLCSLYRPAPEGTSF